MDKYFNKGSKRTYIRPQATIKGLGLGVKLLTGSGDVHSDNYGPWEEGARSRYEFNFQSCSTSSNNCANDINWDF